MTDVEYVQANPFSFEMATRGFTAYMRVEDDSITVGADIEGDEDCGRRAFSLADALCALLRLASEFATTGTPEAWPMVRAVVDYHLEAQRVLAHPVIVNLPRSAWN